MKYTVSQIKTRFALEKPFIDTRNNLKVDLLISIEKTFRQFERRNLLEDLYSSRERYLYLSSRGETLTHHKTADIYRSPESKDIYSSRPMMSGTDRKRLAVEAPTLSRQSAGEDSFVGDIEHGDIEV